MTSLRATTERHDAWRGIRQLSALPRHAERYLRKLRCASLSKLSKSMESYLLLVEAGSKSSESRRKTDVLNQAHAPSSYDPHGPAQGSSAASL